MQIEVTPDQGDVEIWVKEFETHSLEAAYNAFPESKKEADFASGAQRNKLYVNHTCSDCYLLIAIINKRTTSYDFTVTTHHPDNDK